MVTRWHPLHTAAISGNLKNVKQEYRKGGSDILEQTDANGCTALHFGSLSGNADVVKELIRLGSDVNRRSSGMGSVTPLILATTKNHLNAVRVLLDEGSDPFRERMRDGWNPIHICAEHDFSDIARLLLEHSPALVQAKDHKGHTCLDIARRKKSVEFINIAVYLNLSSRSISDSNVTSAASSATGGPERHSSTPLGSVKKERKSAGDYNPSLMQTIFDAARAGDCAGLEAACRSGPEDACEVVNAQQRSGWTVLMEAAAVGRHQAIKTLIGLGAELEARNKKGMTALHIAVRYGYVQTVRALLDGGACADAVTRKGDTIEELAASHKHLTLLAYLVNRRAARTALSPSSAADGRSAAGPVSGASPAENRPGEVNPTDLSPSTSSYTPSSRGFSDIQSDVDPSVGENLRNWLSEIGLGQYHDVLHANGFEDLSSLSVLTDEDMASLGLLLGHRRIFRAEIVKLQERHPSLFVPRSLSFTPVVSPSPEALSCTGDAMESHRGRSFPPRPRRTASAGPSRRSKGARKKHVKEKTSAGTFPVSSLASERTSGEALYPDVIDEASHIKRAMSAPPETTSVCTSDYVSADVLRPGPGRSPATTSYMVVSSASTSDLSGTTEFSADGPDSRPAKRIDETLTIGPGVKRLEYDEIDIGGVVGEGSFGTVRGGWWRGMHVAVKALRVTDAVERSEESADTSEESTGHRYRHLLSTAQAKELLHEAETMARVCNHSFVIQFIGIVLDPVPCVVTLFCENGSVENLIMKSTGKLPDEDTLLRFALETAMGVRHLHLEGIIHRDLATRNLLIDETFHIRVADFGFARVKDAAASKGYTNSTMGPVRWSAPEAMRRRRYSESSDVFSFGVVLYELFAQSIPWPGYDTLDVAVRVCGGERMDIPPEVPLDVADLMILCWSHEEVLRPTLNDVIDSIKFMREDIALVERENRELMWMLNGAWEGQEGNTAPDDVLDGEEILHVNTRLRGSPSKSTASYSDMSPSYGVAGKVLFES